MKLGTGCEDVMIFICLIPALLAYVCMHLAGGLKAGETHLGTCNLLPLSSFSYMILHTLCFFPFFFFFFPSM